MASLKNVKLKMKNEKWKMKPEDKERGCQGGGAASEGDWGNEGKKMGEDIWQGNIFQNRNGNGREKAQKSQKGTGILYRGGTGWARIGNGFPSAIFTQKKEGFAPGYPQIFRLFTCFYAFLRILGIFLFFAEFPAQGLAGPNG
jgi:hypothetical protein